MHLEVVWNGCFLKNAENDWHSVWLFYNSLFHWTPNFWKLFQLLLSPSCRNAIIYFTLTADPSYFVSRLRRRLPRYCWHVRSNGSFEGCWIARQFHLRLRAIRFSLVSIVMFYQNNLSLLLFQSLSVAVWHSTRSFRSSSYVSVLTYMLYICSSSAALLGMPCIWMIVDHLKLFLSSIWFGSSPQHKEAVYSFFPSRYISSAYALKGMQVEDQAAFHAHLRERLKINLLLDLINPKQQLDFRWKSSAWLVNANNIIPANFIKTQRTRNTYVAINNVRQGRNHLIFDIFGGANWCNVLLHLKNTYVCEIFGGAIARLPPCGCGPDVRWRDSAQQRLWLYWLFIFS